MPKYRAKPFTIEAVQYRNLLDVDLIRKEFSDIHLTRGKVWDHLQRTWVHINDGDYIIRGMKGEYYPCAAEVFEAKYEAVDEEL